MCFLFTKKTPVPVPPEHDFELDITPESTKPIDAEKIKSIIMTKFPEVPEMLIYIADKTAVAPSYNDIAKFLAQDDTNKMGYRSNDRDCDDFAHRLKGQFSVPGWSHILLGTVWTTGHALNWTITEDNEFVFIEPQADRIDPDYGEGKTFRFFMT